MKRGTGSIKRATGGRCLFAVIALDVELTARSSFTVDLEEDAQGWERAYLPTIQAAVGFAAEKILFKLQRQDLFNLSVTLKRVVVTAADSTCTAVFYATLLAVEDALEIKIPDVEPNWTERELKIKF
jgi:hypothetical protein